MTCGLWIGLWIGRGSGYVFRRFRGFCGFSGLRRPVRFLTVGRLFYSLVPTSCLVPSGRKKMEAMVVEFDTFDSHPSFLLNWDVGTGCSRGVFQQVSPCTSLLSLCVQGRCNLRDHGTSLFFHDSGEYPLFLSPIVWR